MDDDDDYFIPTNSSRRLAMLFNPEDIGSSSSITGHHADPVPNFKFVAPKQPRTGRRDSSASTSSGTGHTTSRDGTEVLLDVALSVLSQGAERSGTVKTPVSCQVVGNAVRRSFTLVVVVVVQDKGELWRVAVDSHLLLEVVERSTLRVTAHGKSLTLLGDAQRMEDFVTQLAIFRAVATDGPTQQDLWVGKGHILAEGDVAKVCYCTYDITSTALKGHRWKAVKSLKATVSPASEGGWESCLAGMTVDSHRLIFLPELKEGKWLPPSTFYDITVVKVRTKGNKEKPPTETVTAAATSAAAAVVSNNNSHTKPQQQEIVTSHDANTASPQNFTGQNGDIAESQGTQEEDSQATRKAALVSRMAQLGTALFPLLPSAKVPSQPSEATVEASVESQETPVEGGSVPLSTPPPPTPISNSTTPVSTPSTGLSSAPVSVLTTTTPVSVPTQPSSQLQSHSPALDSTLALSICQLGTSVARISDRVDLLLTKVDRVEVGASPGSSFPASDPEALMSLARGLVAHNERLRADVEALEGKLAESQTSCTSLLTMNAGLLEEKREMLRRESDKRKEEEDKKEDLVDKEEPVKEEEDKETQTETEAEEDNRGLTPDQVRSLLKSTLSGLFRHLSGTFSEEEQYTRPQILRTARSGLEVAYSNLLENLEEMTEVRGAAMEVKEEGGGGGGGEEKGKHGEDVEEEENVTSPAQVEVRSGESDPGEEIYEDFATEERWKEKEEEEELNEKPSVNSTLEIESLNLKENCLSKNEKKEEEEEEKLFEIQNNTLEIESLNERKDVSEKKEDLNNSTSLCLEAEDRPEADQ